MTRQVFLKSYDKTIVILCPPCQGGGKLPERVSANETEMTTCGLCMGSGRILKRKQVSYEPFIPKD